MEPSERPWGTERMSSERNETRVEISDGWVQVEISTIFVRGYHSSSWTWKWGFLVAHPSWEMCYNSSYNWRKPTYLAYQRYMWLATYHLVITENHQVYLQTVPFHSGESGVLNHRIAKPTHSCCFKFRLQSTGPVNLFWRYFTILIPVQLYLYPNLCGYKLSKINYTHKNHPNRG